IPESFHTVPRTCGRLAAKVAQVVNWFTRLARVIPCVVVLLASLWGAGAGAQEAASVEQQLVDRYLPVIFVREHEYTCARPPEQGEPYLPVPVEMVLGNERVLLRDGANNDMVIGEGVDAV